MLHLGMSGSLRVLPADMPRLPHDHFDSCSLPATRCVSTIRGGSAACTTSPGILNEHPLLAKLAPEPLEEAFNADYLWRVTRRRKVAIKQLLMNSQLVVGVGNIYANEALFRAKVRPKKAGAQPDTGRNHPPRQSREIRSIDGDSSGRHDTARLCRRRWSARLFPAEAVCLRTQQTTLPGVPHAGPAAHAGTAFNILLSEPVKKVSNLSDDAGVRTGGCLLFRR